LASSVPHSPQVDGKTGVHYDPGIETQSLNFFIPVNMKTVISMEDKMWLLVYKILEHYENVNLGHRVSECWIIII
jgi:hypothetical protein